MDLFETERTNSEYKQATNLTKNETEEGVSDAENY